MSDDSTVVRQTVTTETQGWGEHARWRTTTEIQHYDNGEWTLETTTQQRLLAPEDFLRAVLKPAWWPKALQPVSGRCDCQHCRDLAAGPTG